MTNIAKKIANSISMPTKKFELKDGNEIEFAQLSIGGLAEVNKRIGINLWEHILDTFSGNLEDMADAENPQQAAQNVDQKAMINFLKGLHYNLQLELAWESLKTSLGKETTESDADKIFSWGLNDDQQMQALMFILQGVQEEDIEEKAVGDSKKQKNSKKTSST